MFHLLFDCDGGNNDKLKTFSISLLLLSIQKIYYCDFCDFCIGTLNASSLKLDFAFWTICYMLECTPYFRQIMRTNVSIAFVVPLRRLAPENNLENQLVNQRKLKLSLTLYLHEPSA